MGSMRMLKMLCICCMLKMLCICCMVDISSGSDWGKEIVMV